MKKLSIITGALLWCITATAGMHCPTAPLDSTRTKIELKKIDSKNATGITTKSTEKPKEIKAEEKRSETVAKAKPELDVPIKAETKPAQTAGNSMKAESRATAEEIKEMAKMERESKKPEKESGTPTVSYPYYPGGNIAVREFVRKNMRYPEECKRERLTGRVEVLIAIAPDGTPHSATISKSSGNVHMDAEALRIAELMPKWQPAEESDDPQGLDYVIYVNFRPGR